MLVLTRKAGEKIVLGNSTILTVIEIKGGTVRLGFEAPAAVSIYRDEVYREIAGANREAMGLERRSAGEAGAGTTPAP